ncbi:NlpC/P60 family protein [Pseudonocardia sp. NPDC049635]|uniref:C40 family peptidase n=1 Tax=Pseudonocardia sp. NPDC049635 TaxID=3155506 RepID=UPI0033EECDD9
MTTALNPVETPATELPDIGTPRRRRDRDAGAGISAAELLSRYAEAGFDTPTSGGRRAARAARTGAFGPAIEQIDTPATGFPVAPLPGADDSIVSRDLPAGVTSRSAIGLVSGTSDTGPFGRNPRAVAATMSATLVGATAVMGVVTAISAPDDQAAEEHSAGVGLAGVNNEATMTLSLPAAGSEQGGAGTSEAATTLGNGLEQATAAVPQAFEQADAARIAAVAQQEAEERAERERARAGERAANNAGRGAGSGAGDVVGDLSGSATGLQALATAKTALGAPYKWGATGPNAFDCSGLMVWAFEQAGIDLPRTSSAQSQMGGQSVSKSQLKPGDMVFFYSPVSHVGIYAGNGKILHASTSGEPVKYSDIDAMPFHNAIRV